MHWHWYFLLVISSFSQFEIARKLFKSSYSSSMCGIQFQEVSRPSERFYYRHKDHHLCLASNPLFHHHSHHHHRPSSSSSSSLETSEKCHNLHIMIRMMWHNIVIKVIIEHYVIDKIVTIILTITTTRSCTATSPVFLLKIYIFIYFNWWWCKTKLKHQNGSPTSAVHE